MSEQKEIKHGDVVRAAGIYRIVVHLTKKDASYEWEIQITSPTGGKTWTHMKPVDAPTIALAGLPNLEDDYRHEGDRLVWDE